MITFSSLFVNAAAFILHTSSHYQEFRVYPTKFFNIYYYNKSIIKYILVYHMKHVVWHEYKLPGVRIMY